MQAIREIRDVFSEELVLHLPAEFLQQTVEIIVLPIDGYALQRIRESEIGEPENEIDELSCDLEDSKI